jgi:hypothetical protein
VRAYWLQHLVKLMLDNTGTYHSLHKLVYMDISDVKIREVCTWAAGC